MKKSLRSSFFCLSILTFLVLGMLVFVSTAPANLDDMVLINGGSFLMGEGSQQHRVTLSSFYIDKYEVTNQDYGQFISAGGYSNSAYWTTEGWNYITTYGITYPITWSNGTYTSGHEAYPVYGISWYEADAFARWAGKRLPTEAEWEYAASGMLSRTYPWGESLPTSSHANYNNNVGAVQPIGYYGTGATFDGVHDLAGNVAEWVSDWYGTLGTDEQTDPQGPSTGFEKVFKGGAWYYSSDKIKNTFRSSYRPDTQTIMGFRCAKDASDSPTPGTTPTPGPFITPPWKGFMNAGHNEGNTVTSGPDRGDTIWTLNFTDPVKTHVIMKSGSVIASSGLRLYSIYPNGVLEWTKEIDGVVSGITLDDNDNMYAIINGYLVKNPQTSEWTSSTSGYAGRPTITLNGNIYVGKPGNDNVWATADCYNSDGEVVRFVTGYGANIGAGLSGYNADFLYQASFSHEGAISRIFSTTRDGAATMIASYYGMSEMSVDQYNKIYFSSLNDSIGDVPRFICVNENGDLSWETVVGTTGDPGIGTAPAMDGLDTLYVVNQKNGGESPAGVHTTYLQAYDFSGVLQWSYHLGGYDNTLQPIIDSEGVIYASSGSDLYAINSDGTLKWSAGIGADGSLSAPIMNGDGTLYVTSSTTLYAINDSNSSTSSGNPEISLSMDKQTYSSGDNMTLNATVSGSYSSNVDVYIALVFPDGSFMALNSDVQFAETDLVASIVSGWNVSAGTYPLTFSTENMSSGEYSWYVIFANSNSNVLDSSNWINYNVINFSVQ